MSGVAGVRGEALEVWGDPIDHSRSPALHTAAYAALGVPWSYGRRQVTVGTFDGELADLDPTFRGLSLTYPLKGLAHAAAAVRDSAAELTGSVNTLLTGVDGGPRGYNTDVGGIVRDLREHGVDQVGAARIVGAGATAASALVALAELGAATVEVVARRPHAAALLQQLGDRLGVVVRPVPLVTPTHAPVPVTIAALPGDAALSPEVADAVATPGGILYDVVYGTWPTPLAEAWTRAGGRAISGLGMLLHQALLQVRLFRSGDAAQPLPDEAAVLAAMRDAVG